MRRRFALLALAFCTILHAADAPSDDAPDPAFREYKQKLIADFAKSRDARHLLAAAAYTSIDPDPSAAKRARELYARAAAAGADDTVVQWVAALQTCDKGKPCAALDRIRDDNAIVPIAALDYAKGATAALPRAASAKRYDDYLWKVAQALYAATADGPAVNEATRISNSLGVAVAVAIPRLGELMRVCLREPRRESAPDCLRIAKMMTAGEGSMLSYRLGARVIAARSDDAAEREAWQARIDESESMIKRSDRAVNLLITDAAGVADLKKAFTQSRDEMGFQRAVIIAAAARGN